MYLFNFVLFCSDKGSDVVGIRAPPTNMWLYVHQLVSTCFDLWMVRWRDWPQEKNPRPIKSDREHVDLRPVHCGLSHPGNLQGNQCVQRPMNNNERMKMFVYIFSLFLSWPKNLYSINKRSIFTLSVSAGIHAATPCALPQELKEIRATREQSHQWAQCLRLAVRMGYLLTTLPLGAGSHPPLRFF